MALSVPLELFRNNVMASKNIFKAFWNCKFIWVLKLSSILFYHLMQKIFSKSSLTERRVGTKCRTLRHCLIETHSCMVSVTHFHFYTAIHFLFLQEFELDFCLLEQQLTHPAFPIHVGKSQIFCVEDCFPEGGPLCDNDMKTEHTALKELRELLHLVC